MSRNIARDLFTKLEGQINVDQEETVITPEKALTHS